MSNILPFMGAETAKCKVGSLARHPEHGCVTVVAAEGLQRTIEITDYRELTAVELRTALPSGVAPHEVLRGEELIHTYINVPVQTLRDLDREASQLCQHVGA